MSALVSGAAALALTVGLSAAVALESTQVQPQVLRVQRHGPPGPALIEKLEATGLGSEPRAPTERHTSSDQVSDFGATVSDVCRSASSLAPVTPDAMLCALSNRVAPLLETMLAGLDVSR